MQMYTVVLKIAANEELERLILSNSSVREETFHGFYNSEAVAKEVAENLGREFEVRKVKATFSYSGS